MKLNLGSGGRKLAGHTNVDLEPQTQPDVVCDLGKERWPFADGSVDEMLAEHFLEHLPNDAFLRFMCEAWRVGKNGSTLKVLLPHPRHDIFLNDPTHVLPIVPATFFGFSKKHLAALAAQDIYITPLGKHLGIDFNLSGKISYFFDPAVDVKDPELEWKIKHLFNIVSQWGMTLTVVK